MDSVLTVGLLIPAGLVFVRSIDHDSFKKEEIKALENGGNTYVNRFYEALLSSNDPCKIGPSSSVVNANPSSVFDQAAPVDQNTIAQYESFVRKGNEDSESEYSGQHGGGDDVASVSSEESDAWHISHGGNNGLDVYVDL